MVTKAEYLRQNTFCEYVDLSLISEDVLDNAVKTVNRVKDLFSKSKWVYKPRILECYVITEKNLITFSINRVDGKGKAEFRMDGVDLVYKLCVDDQDILPKEINGLDDVIYWILSDSTKKNSGPNIPWIDFSLTTEQEFEIAKMSKVVALLTPKETEQMIKFYMAQFFVYQNNFRKVVEGK